ncbi:exonuclease domain-containing protein [Verrucomicrobiota bacterium]
MNFTAIDFETANSSRGSACAVGLCVVQNGQITQSVQHLIRPDPPYFAPFNISIHGITDQDVAGAPSFIELWPEVLASISGPLVAHNASFDISVIRRSLDDGGMDYPDIDYYCTRVISKLTWPDMPTYALDHVAQHLGLSFQHHNAAEDARACACVALAACRVHAASSLCDLEEPFVFATGRLFPGGYSPCHGRGKDPSIRGTSSAKLRAADISAVVTEFDPDHPFFGKSFVFTGAMTALVRKDAMQAVVDCGGVCHDTVKQDTNYLVLGQKGYIVYRSGHKSSKMKKAESILSKGFPIEILSEADFVSML